MLRRGIWSMGLCPVLVMLDGVFVGGLLWILACVV